MAAGIPAITNKRSAWVADALIALLLFGVLTFYSGDGPAGTSGPRAERWGTWLSWAARLLTVPLDTPSPADIRTLLFPVVCGVALLWLAVRQRGAALQMAASDGFSIGAIGRGNLVVIGLLIGTLLWSCVSAQANATWDFSTGWLVMQLTSVAWCAWLWLVIPRARVWRLMVIGLLVGGAGLLLALWHRQHMGLRYFTWPIGALTPTAGMAALLAATAGAAVITLAGGVGLGSCAASPVSAAALTEWKRRRATTLALLTAICVIAMSVAWLAGRRAPLLGLGAGVMLAIILLMAARGANRRLWLVTGVLAVAVVVLAGLWVRGQAQAPRVEVSGPVSLRLAYWRESVALVGESPWLGHGPDSFAPTVTPRFALRRAESPQVYHGDIDPHAHNEWLQAMVELGIPGGLAYLAAPCAAIILTLLLVRANRAAPPAAAPTLFDARIALAAGVGCVLVSEFASTSMRGPILAPWYWTWLGLLMAANKPATIVSESAATAVLMARVVRIVLTGLGVALLALVMGEFQRMTATAQAQAGLRTGQPAEWVDATMNAARGRWGFSAWWGVETDFAHAGMEAASASGPANEHADRDGLQRWVQLKNRFGFMRGVRVDLARALIANNDAHIAGKELITYLERVDPYDPQANILLITHARHSPAERLDGLTAALRSTGVTDEIEALAIEAWSNATTLAHWSSRLENPSTLPSPRHEAAQDTLRPERLRLEARRLARAADLASAIVRQREAAEWYRDAYQSDPARRRRHAAEWDAWYQLALLYWDRTQRDPQLAMDAVRWAERFAVMGCAHEHRRLVSESDEYLGGHVVLTASPPELRPLWRLSAAIRLANGLTDAHTTYRLLLALPEQHQNMAAAAELRDTLLRE